MKTYDELLAEARKRVSEIGVREALALREASPDAVFLDVREIQESNLGKISAAVVVPRGNLEKNIERLVPRERKVIVYCASGNRSVFVAEVMTAMGYGDVRSLSGG